jgi:hypothetical protein
MGVMDLPSGSVHDGAAIGGAGDASALAVFTPMVLSGPLGWVRITPPQAAARAACLAVTAHIHLLRPDIPLRDLDHRAEAAIRALEDGAGSVTVIDELYRVDRAALFPFPPGPAG